MYFAIIFFVLFAIIFMSSFGFNIKSTGAQAVTVLTYLHGVKEAEVSIDPIISGGADIDLIELRTLKPLDLETIGMSLRRTHKVREMSLVAFFHVACCSTPHSRREICCIAALW